MPSIELDSVSVSYSVYTAGHRSLKNATLSATTGGHIGNDANRLVVQALDTVSLTLRDGDRPPLIGHNGAGKTTLLHGLAGIFEPLKGGIRADSGVNTTL